MSESTRAAVGAIAWLSLEPCRKRGGAVISGPRDLGSCRRMSVTRDPAGAPITHMQLPG